MKRTYDVELLIWTLKIEKKIERRQRIVSYHSRKSRVEREFCLATLENREKKEKRKLSNFRDRERNFSFYSRFFSRERDFRQCVIQLLGSWHLLARYYILLFSFHNEVFVCNICISVTPVSFVGTQRGFSLSCLQPISNPANIQRWKPGRLRLEKAWDQSKKLLLKRKAWTRQPPRPPCQPSYQG